MTNLMVTVSSYSEHFEISFKNHIFPPSEQPKLLTFGALGEKLETTLDFLEG